MPLLLIIIIIRINFPPLTVNSPTEFMTSPRGKAICDEMWQETLDILSKYAGMSGDVLGR